MPSLRLKSRNIKINDENFDTVEEAPHGNFAFGFINLKSRFVPAYIGRSKNNLREELKAASEQQMNEGKHYTHFKYEVAYTREDAYEKECKSYHEFAYRKDGSTRQLDNTNHPTGGTCPFENCYQ